MSSLPPIDGSLAALVAPADVPEFRDHYWKQRPFFTAGDAERLGSALGKVAATPIAWLVGQSEYCVVLQPDAYGRQSPRHSIAGALELYEKGAGTLHFKMKDDWPLAKWMGALANELGELPLGVMSLFAVRKGGGTRPHLDWVDNFTVQIRGSKRWAVAPSDFVTEPVSNWVIGDPAPPWFDSPRLPNEMPPHAKDYVLTAGSVLYVPRGYLHQVTAMDDADSLSISMTLSPTPWAVALCTLLTHQLLDHAEFREVLCGAFGKGWGREQVRALMPEKVDKLCQHARSVGDALLGLMEDPEKLRDYLVKRTYPRYG